MVISHKFLMGSSALMVAIAAQPAIAQDASGSGAEEATTWQGDIIVTARRREETAQDTPVAMTVLNDELLERYAVTGIDSIASLTPGLVTGDSSGSVGGSISLRGVGSGDAQAFIDQAVSINVDGVPISTAQIQRVAQMDLKQIEVLRGPQTLFFGKNSPGGIISLTTADPGDELEMMVRAGYEFEAQEWSIDATVSAPLTETLGVRLAGHYADMDGYFDVISPVDLAAGDPQVRASGLDAFPNRKELFLRGTMLFEPTDRLSVNLKATYADTKIKGGPSYFSDIVHCPYGDPQEIYVVSSNCKADGTIVAAKIPTNVLALNPLLKENGHRDNEQLLISGTINYDLTDALTLTSVTGYYNVDEEISSNGGYGLAATNVFSVLFENEQFSQELRLASDFDGSVNFLVGGFFEDRKLFTETYIVVPYGFGSCPTCLELPVEAQRQKQTSYSAFGQLIFSLEDRFELTAGGRYTHEKKKLLGQFVTTEPFADPGPILDRMPINIVDQPGYAGARELTFNNFSPEVTATFKPIEDVMVFASYKEGFKSGGIDGAYTAGAVLANGPVTFEPEEVSGFEVGVKSALADRQLIFNVTGYRYIYDNLQVTTYDANARSFGTANAAKARVQGIEVETSFSPRDVPGLELHTSVAYNDAKFKEFLARCYQGQTVALGCNNNFDATSGLFNTQDLSGRQLRKAPKFTGIIGGYYETPVSSGLMIGLSADLFYSGKYNYGSEYQPYTIQDSFAKLDASLRLFTEDKRWEFALVGRNLTNEYNQNNGIDRTGTGTGRGTDQPTCTTAAQTGCAKLPDVIGTYSRGRSVTAQVTFRY